jgi:hypothetical protein
MGEPSLFGIEDQHADALQTTQRKFVKSLLLGVVQMCADAMTSNGTRLDQIDEVLDRMESLLPDPPMEYDISSFGSDLITSRDLFSSPFYRVIIYSILNGFAGFAGFDNAGIPPTWI